MPGVNDDPEPEKPAPDLGDGPAPVEKPVSDPLKPEGHKERGWWLQDVAGYAATLTDHVNKYKPTLQQVDLDAPDYTLLDPSRQLAAQQEQANRFAEVAQNTSSGSVARANMLAQSGEQGKQAADILAQTENANVQIVNQAAGAGSGVQNQETLTNAKLQDDYFTKSAIADQQYDNAVNKLKYKRLGAFMNGVTNSQKQRQMEDVLFPQYAVDRNTGEVHFSGVGKNYEADQAGYGNPADASDKLLRVYSDAYKKARADGLPEKAAQDIARQQQQMYTPRGAQNSKAMFQQLMMNGRGGAPAMPQVSPYEYDND
jgi:hypothetical protein